MANKVKLKRSYTAGAVPLTTDLDTNECCVNWADGKLFTKNAAGNIVSVTLGGGGSGSGSIVTAATVAGFPATGASGTLYLATDTARVYEWQGAYVECGTSGGGGDGTDTVLRSLFVPPAPTGVTAAAGNAQATLSWTAPTVLAQTPITDYTVQYSSNSGSSWTTFSRSASTAATATVTGLTNGTAYVFRVAGINSIGTGTYTAASSSVTPTAVSVPGAVTNLRSSAPGCGSAEVAWDAPSSNGGSAITGYRVVVTGNAYIASTNTTQSASVRTKTVNDGYYGDQSFSVAVYAINAVGESPSATVTGRTGGCN
jgi:hypothetical protein